MAFKWVVVVSTVAAAIIVAIAFVASLGVVFDKLSEVSWIIWLLFFAFLLWVGYLIARQVA